VSPAVALVTYPADLSSNAPQIGKGKGRAADGPIMTSDAWLKSIAGASDACIELQGFACEYPSCRIPSSDLIDRVPCSRPEPRSFFPSFARSGTCSCLPDLTNAASPVIQAFDTARSRSRQYGTKQPQLPTKTKEIRRRDPTPRRGRRCRRASNGTTPNDEELWCRRRTRIAYP